MAFSPKAWLDALRSLDRLLNLEKAHRALIERQADEIQALKDRVTKLEAREEILVAEAKGAAAAVASAVSSQHIADLAEKVGALRGRLDSERKRLD